MAQLSRKQSREEPFDLLLVEDNPADARLVREAFEAIDSATDFQTVTDGDEAVDFLKAAGTEETPASPDLAIVDLDLPGRDGCEVLDEIRADPRLRRLPVIILTGSEDSEDMARCYASDANAYITKPDDYDDLTSLAEAVDRFWLDRAQLPPVP